jgi:hypothetical protein
MYGYKNSEVILYFLYHAVNFLDSDAVKKNYPLCFTTTRWKKVLTIPPECALEKFLIEATVTNLHDKKQFYFTLSCYEIRNGEVLYYRLIIFSLDLVTDAP